MITIIFNNKPIQLAGASTLQAFLEEALPDSLRSVCAVAVNRQFVPREQRAQTYLREMDVVDLVLPMQGG